VICPTVKDLFFGSLGVDYFGFFSQWGYPLSQKQATTLGRSHLLARRDRKAPKLHRLTVLQLGTDPARHQAAVAAIDK